MTDYPYLYTETCPDCHTPLVGIVHLVYGTPRPTGGLVRAPLEPEMVWMAACPHVETTDDRPLAE